MPSAPIAAAILLVHFSALAFGAVGVPRGVLESIAIGFFAIELLFFYRTAGAVDGLREFVSVIVLAATHERDR